MRPVRYIGGNQGCEGPRNLIFVDTESNQHVATGNVQAVHHTLKLWCASRVRLEGDRVSRKQIATGTTAEAFWQFVDRCSDASRRTWVFAHNVGFDFTLLAGWEELDKGRLTLDPMYRQDRKGKQTADKSWSGKLVIDGQVTFIVCRNGKKTYTIVDTMNYWPRKLWEIGRANGLPQVEKPADDAPDSEWRRRCKRDVEIIEYAVVDMVRRWVREGCGVFQTTAAGLAFQNWRHSCDVRTPDGRSPDVVPMPDHPSHRLERESYFGGRIQPYHIGEMSGPVWHVDVNSLYPFVMHEHSFPRRYVRAYWKPPVEVVANASRVLGVVAEVFIRSRDDTYPVRIDGRQFHCCGAFWTVLAGPELQRAIDRGHAVRFGRVQTYSVAPLFRTWVRYWFGRKLKALAADPPNPGEVEFCGTILKALSGKFAQHGRRWESLPGRIPIERWGGWTGPHPQGDAGSGLGLLPGSGCGPDMELAQPQWVHYRGIAGHTQYLATDSEPNHAFPAITSFITAYAREYVYGIIEQLPAGSVYYSATDSLFVSEAGFRKMKQLRLIHPTALGKFKVKGKHSRGEIYGANYYELDGEVTAAGWAKGPPRPVGAGEMCEVWERLPSIVSTGPRHTVVVQQMPVGPYRPDRKGTIDALGNWQPFRLSDDPEFTDRPKAGGYSIDDLDRLRADDWK